MSERKNLLFAIILAVIVFAAALALVAQGDNKAPDTITTESIGYVDLNLIHEKFPDFVRLKDLKAAYETEINTYGNYLRQSAATYLQELEKNQEEEMTGKTDEQKAEIQKK